MCRPAPPLNAAARRLTCPPGPRLLRSDHIAQGADFQTRVRWRPGTVVLWDNRSTVHTAIIDFRQQGARRHGARSVSLCGYGSPLA